MFKWFWTIFSLGAPDWLFPWYGCGLYMKWSGFKSYILPTVFFSCLYSLIYHLNLYDSYHVFWEMMTIWLWGIYSGHIFLSVTVILLDIVNAFQIWSTLAGYERLDGEFEQIRNGEGTFLLKKHYEVLQTLLWSRIMTCFWTYTYRYHDCVVGSVK